MRNLIEDPPDGIIKHSREHQDVLVEALKEKDGKEENDGFNVFYLLMLRQIKAHECLCIEYNPCFHKDLHNRMYHTIETEYANSVSVQARLDIYNAVIEKYKGEAEFKARENVREELKQEIAHQYKG